MGYKYPYKNRVRKSVITKELKDKHKLGLTLSPIDLCLRKNLITQPMHRAANHFIFLHNSRFGSSQLKCQISRCYYQLLEHRTSYEATEEELKRVRYEYVEVTDLLKSLKAYNLMLNVCVYNIYPVFLRRVGSLDKLVYDEFLYFKRALEEMNEFMIELVRRTY